MNNLDRDKTIEKHYRSHYKKLVKLVAHRVPNKSHHLAEEVVSEAFCRALAYWTSFNPDKGSFSMWFSRILSNATTHCVLSEANLVSLDDDDYNLEDFVVIDDYPKDLARLVQKSIEEANPNIAEVLHMFFNLGFKTIDIHRCTGHTHTNVRQIIHRFKNEWGDENIFGAV
jgi:RNA polymerase sigma factor (sigma-70 family)